MPLDIKDGRLLDVAKPAGVDISDADSDVGNVMSPKTFYSVAPPRKTGTMPTVAITAANDDYPVGYHAGNVGGLDAIDADLAPGNIKSGVTIFGKLGTFVGGPLSHDTAAGAAGFKSGTEWTDEYYEYSVLAGDNSNMAWSSATVVDDVVIEAFASLFYAGVETSSTIKLQLLIGGVQVAESAYLSTSKSSDYITGYKEGVASGGQSLITRIHNYAASTKYCRTVYATCFGGSVKL